MQQVIRNHKYYSDKYQARTDDVGAVDIVLSSHEREAGGNYRLNITVECRVEGREVRRTEV